MRLEECLKSLSQDYLDYLDLAGGPVGEFLPYLLWSRDDSAATILVARGSGKSTGDDTIQTMLKYHDTETGACVGVSFAMIGLDPGVAITDGAENFLLSQVIEAAESLTIKHQE
jgi:hypothetical protein